MTEANDDTPFVLRGLPVWLRTVVSPILMLIGLLAFVGVVCLLIAPPATAVYFIGMGKPFVAVAVLGLWLATVPLTRRVLAWMIQGNENLYRFQPIE